MGKRASINDDNGSSSNGRECEYTWRACLNLNEGDSKKFINCLSKNSHERCFCFWMVIVCWHMFIQCSVLNLQLFCSHNIFNICSIMKWILRITRLFCNWKNSNIPFIEKNLHQCQMPDWQVTQIVFLVALVAVARLVDDEVRWCNDCMTDALTNNLPNVYSHRWTYAHSRKKRPEKLFTKQTPLIIQSHSSPQPPKAKCR